MKTLLSIGLFTLIFSIVGGALGAHIYSLHPSSQVLGVKADNKLTNKPEPQPLQKVEFEGMTLSIPKDMQFETLISGNIHALVLTTKEGKISLSVTQTQTQVIESLLTCKENCEQQTWGNVTFAIHDQDNKRAFSAKGNDLLTISFSDIEQDTVQKTLNTLVW